MAKKTIVAAIVCVLCGIIVCACGNNTKDMEAGKQAFGGTWVLYEIQSDDDDAADHNDIQGLKDTGKECKLYLNEDGSAKLDLFGAVKEGKWEVQNALSAVLTLGNSKQVMEMQNDRLYMQSNDDRLVFEHDTAAANTEESNGIEQGSEAQAGA